MDEADAIERLSQGDLRNPHALLGPHPAPGGVVVRALRPAAAEVWLEPAGGAALRMERVHPAGVFAAVVEGATLPIRYRIRADGVATDDAYAFAPTIGELDLHLIAEGKHEALATRMGAHPREIDGAAGTAFSVWAPNAQSVAVVGDFNGWDRALAPMRRLDGGVWELFMPGVGDGAHYKFDVTGETGVTVAKADPFARAAQLRPLNASRVHTSRYAWGDDAWMTARAKRRHKKEPVSIYEVHLGSWRTRPATDPRDLGPDTLANDPARLFYSYREIADLLVPYVVEMGFTHVELMPVMEHPYDGSWGYQITGYFAPTSRYGDPDDFRALVDRLHAAGVGVLLDWAPAHFPRDAWALGRFDGTPLFEHPDPLRGEHRQWGTFVFDYGRPQVKAFLVASALTWLEDFHVDGLRVDAVASMLYLDYGTDDPDAWEPNEHGGRENLEAVAFVKELADAVRRRAPGAFLCAEESTSWPGVTKPTYVGGLGFDFKWNMGWMHDTLDYFALDPIHRTFHHRLVTFGLMYAFNERFVLPLSHDEVVHLKKSLLSKMPGDRWKMHATLRALYGWMWSHPGKKLLFMGGEIGQYSEWTETRELDWWLLGEADHLGLQRWVKDLNGLYAERGALSEIDDSFDGFRWIDANDAPQSVASFVRYPKQPPSPPPQPGEPKVAEKPRTKGKHVVFVGNFTPVPRYGYRVGVPRAGRYVERLNSDARDYGGSGMGNLGVVETEPVASHGFAQSLVLTLPPLASMFFVPELEDDPPPPVLESPKTPA